MTVYSLRGFTNRSRVSGPLYGKRTARMRVYAVVVLAILGLFVLWHAIATSVRAAGKPQFYTVQVGDTVWSIAERASTGADPRPEIAAIIDANHLDSDESNIFPGQVLLIPMK